MQALLIYALKACICSGILFLYYFVALRNKRFHYYNRFYLLMSIVLSLLLPFIHITLWQLHSDNRQVVQLMNRMLVNDTAVTVNSNSFLFYRDEFFLIVCCIITFYLMLTLIFNVAKIFRVKYKYPVEKLDGFDFINTDLRQAPFSFLNNLFWKNTLDITGDTGKQIFKHELTHIRERHSWDKLFMRMITAVFWINPFYWFVQKELTLIHEFIADEKAIENKNAETFAIMLLQAQYGKAIFSPAQSFNYSPIKRRLLMLTTSTEPRFSYARRVLALPLLAFTVLLFAFKLKEDRNAIHRKSEAQAQQPSGTDPEFFDQKVLSDTTAKKPLYIIDGKEATDDEVQKLDASTIESMDVIKKETAVKKWGKKGENGVVLVKLKSSFSSGKMVAPENKNVGSTVILTTGKPDSALIVVDGKVMINSQEFYLMIKPREITKMTILNGEQAIAKYGEKAKSGVVEISTENNEKEKQQTAFFSPPVIAEDKNDSTTAVAGKTDTSGSETYEKEFKTVQILPSFPGGKDAWIKYLQQNLRYGIPTEHKAPSGNYMVIVSFLVKEDGNLSDFKALTDPGFGTAAEAIRVIQRGPKWIPAQQNGHVVTAIAKQAITFSVTEK